MKDKDFQKLDPSNLEIDPVNERVSNVGPHSEEGESLQESIEKTGVIEPIVVREIDNQYKVVAGQRRTLAAQAAGVDTIPARIVEMDDSEARLVSITENAEQFNKDVPAEDRAISIKKLIDDGYSPVDIADKMGFSEPTIQRWLEPALSYWEDTVFEADPENGHDDYGPSDISLQKLRIIRKNTTDKARRERIAKKVVQNNIKLELLREARDKSGTPEQFEDKIDRIIVELNSSVDRVREEVYFSGETATAIQSQMKERGISQKEMIESLVEERLYQIRQKEEGNWIGFKLEDEVSEALESAIENRDIPKRALCKVIIKNKVDGWDV